MMVIFLYYYTYKQTRIGLLEEDKVCFPSIQHQFKPLLAVVIYIQIDLTDPQHMFKRIGHHGGRSE